MPASTPLPRDAACLRSLLVVMLAEIERIVGVGPDAAAAAAADAAPRAAEG